jgi:hypothetical protein
MAVPMKSQIFVAIGILIAASVLVTGLASTIYAQQNMTGGNMTGGNMTGAMSTDGGDGGGYGGSDGQYGGEDGSN